MELAKNLHNAAAQVDAGEQPMAEETLRKASEEWAAAALSNLTGKQRTAALRISAAISDFIQAGE